VRTYTQNKGVIYFPPGSDTLTEEAKKKLDEAAAYVKKEKSVLGVSFQAFPAAKDGEMGNSSLSWNRANNAQSYFMSRMQGTTRPLDVSSFGFANTTFGEGPEADKGKVVIWILRKFEK
jgi:outer membrane protein OmpA-like peptidoglycan-associated protein